MNPNQYEGEMMLPSSITLSYISLSYLDPFNYTSYCLLIVEVNIYKPSIWDPYSIYQTAIQGGVISTLLLD
jgi:hypothetical protein